MSFHNVIGHERPIKLLQRALEQKKVFHSYLFLGNEGIGKRLVALEFAKALNCLEGDHQIDGCDRCSSCKKIDRHLHPDVSLLEPEGQTLKVEQVRERLRELAYRPYEGRRRVIILSAADRMAPDMSNTLLKTLEEPPLHTVIILLANSPKWILPTILSRCQSIRFNPLPVHLVSDWLVKEKGMEESEAHLLASLSEGSPGKALEIKEEISNIPREKLLKEWVGLKSLSIEEQEGAVAFLPSQRKNLQLILEMSKTLLRDLVVTKAGGGHSKLIHRDLSGSIEEIAQWWSLSSLLKRIEALHRASTAVRGNANLRLTLEAMMLTWAEG